MNENPTIVPVKLNDKNNSKPNTSTKNNLACQLKTNEIEVLFYNGIDKHILHAVLAEVGKYAR